MYSMVFAPTDLARSVSPLLLRCSRQHGSQLRRLSCSRFSVGSVGAGGTAHPGGAWAV